MKRFTKTEIDKLSTQDKLKLISEFEEFEREGQIGQCLLRSTAAKIPGGQANITVMMTMVAMETYRHFAKEQLKRIRG